MKTRKLLSVLFAPLVLIALTMNCTNEDDAISLSVSDVSSRVTGFGSTITGAGASLTVNGSQLDKVVRICVGDYCVAKRLFTSVSESSLVFTVPTAVPIGDADVLLVWPGSERGFTGIEVVPLPSISGFVPASAVTGETVTVFGINFDMVSAVNIGGVAGTITSQTATAIQFTVPAAIATDKITLISAAGTHLSATNLTACSAGPTTPDCPDGLNLNSGFELGSGDDFNNWGKYNGGTKMVATTNVTGNEVFRGSRALKVIRDNTITPATDNWRIQLASDLIDTEVGVTYTAFAWIRATVSATGTFPNATTMRFSTSGGTAQYGGNTTIPTTWTRISFSFTADVAQKRIVLDMNGGGPSTIFFIDDVKVIKTN